MLLAGAAAAAPLGAQETVAQAMRRAGSGTVRLQFKARAGVCGSGRSMSFNSYGASQRRTGEWESECEPGPVRVAVDLASGTPTAVRYYVGGRWGGRGVATDVGSVGAADAASYFARLAEHATGKVAREAIVVATLADSANVWPALLRIAKDDTREREVRKNAVFWLGQAASDAAAALNGLAEDGDEDMEVRKQAVFALSQRPADESVPALLKIARGKLDSRIRRTAIFWLGQSGDSRAVAYFEDVLTRP